MATFSSTVILGSRRTCWKVRLMPSPAISRERWPATERPRNSTSPEVGVSTPDSWLNMVLLPAPLGPISARISPAFTLKFMLLLATSPPNRRVTSFTSRIVSPRVGIARRGSAAAESDTRLGGAFTRSTRSTAGHKPSRARCRISSSNRPKRMISKLPAWPKMRGRMSCSHWLSSVTSPAPTTAPHT